MPNECFALRRTPLPLLLLQQATRGICLILLTGVTLYGQTSSVSRAEQIDSAYIYISEEHLMEEDYNYYNLISTLAVEPPFSCTFQDGSGV
jgi:hypothetical protein